MLGVPVYVCSGNDRLYTDLIIIKLNYCLLWEEVGWEGFDFVFFMEETYTRRRIPPPLEGTDFVFNLHPPGWGTDAFADS